MTQARAVIQRYEPIDPQSEASFLTPIQTAGLCF